MKSELILLGLGLLSVGITPTPDDITIISPFLQVIAGTGFILAGLFLEDNNG